MTDYMGEAVQARFAAHAAPAAVSISVVIPVRNEARDIRRTLAGILDQDFPRSRFEIVVVDGCSTDGTTEIVQEVARADSAAPIRLLCNEGRCSAAARNVGIASSVHDYVLIVDGHCEVPSSKLLSSAARLIAATGARALGRPQPFWTVNPTSFEQAVAIARASPVGHALDSHIFSAYEGWVNPSSVAVLYHKSLFREFGGFDERFDAAEDVEFNYRLADAGIRCFTSPQLTVGYRPRDTLRGLLRQMWRYGRGRGQFYRKHPRALSLAAAAPSLAVVTGAVLAGLALHGGPWGLALMSLLGLYALIVLASVRPELARVRPNVLLRAVGLIPAIHVMLGIGMLAGAALPRGAYAARAVLREAGET